MKIKVFFSGKTEEAYLVEGIEKYIKRLQFYIPIEVVTVPALKNAKSLTNEQVKVKEGESLLSAIGSADWVILLDERGKSFSSIEFSEFLQQKMNSGIKTLVFFIGGPYGFSEAVYKRANGLISLSKMTFSHQMVRLFFLEQLYRAFTILKNEPYHHE